MSKIEELARRTLVEIQPPTKAGEPVGDVVVTLAIVEICLKVLLYIYDCWKAANPDSLKKINKPGFVQRFYLRRVVRKVLTANGAASQVDATVAALLSIGKGVTSSDLAAALTETAADPGIAVVAAKYELL